MNAARFSHIFGPQTINASAMNVRVADHQVQGMKDTTYSLEEVAQIATGPHWYQLYMYTLQEAQQTIKQAKEAGYQALVLAVDAPISGQRERDIRNNMINFQLASSKF